MKRIKFISILILCIALIFTFTANVSAVQTPEPIVQYGTHFYQVVTTDYQEFSWSAANEAVSAMTPYTRPGSSITYTPHLVTITTQAEQDFLYSQFSTFGWLWIGLYQGSGATEPSGGWTWVTGEPFSYENWNDNEPNDFSDESFVEWCGVGWLGGWNDNNNAGRTVGFIVEYEVSNIPDTQDCPAAPAIAASILNDLGIRLKYEGGNYVKDVAAMMGSDPADENGSFFMGISKCDVVEYYDAVYSYLHSLGAF